MQSCSAAVRWPCLRLAAAQSRSPGGGGTMTVTNWTLDGPTNRKVGANEAFQTLRAWTFEQGYGELEGRPSRELWDVVDWTDPHWAAEGGESLARLHHLARLGGIKAAVKQAHRGPVRHPGKARNGQECRQKRRHQDGFLL